ncbi:alpha-tocopherol transfer protein-like [Drosophila hydei]|uniref:Alpha-tocopherol transfer protein-like n=1 Tax=Drosophila hydei TaxID=7224 RepID=A0A6J2SW60_DROHY|nr:alpha-tocopherol transfer protein-like [Drosophila hydei]
MLIMDFSGYTAAHLMQVTSSTVKKMSIFAEEAMPVRDKGRHMINTNAAFQMSFNMMQSILPVKQQGRISVHGSNLESLYSYIPQRYLPTHLGGEQGTLEELKQLTWDIFTAQKEYLRAEANYGVDEKLRPAGQSCDYDSIFGVDGSFRKLNID